MRNILVDPKYNPSGKIITSATKLGPGVTMAKFLGAPGSRTQLKKLYNDSFDGPPDFQQIARNLVLHAQIYQSIYGIKQFEQHRLVVSEGIYEPNPKFEVLEVQEGSEASAKKTAAAFLGASFKEKKAGIAAKERLETLISECDGIFILESHGVGKYGRCLGTLLIDDTDINQLLIDEGFAKEYIK